MIARTTGGEELQALAPAFVAAQHRAGRSSATSTPSAAASPASGTRRARASCPRLHGYDTKYAMHALRIGYQGLELLDDRPDHAADGRARSARRCARCGRARCRSPGVLERLDQATGRLEEAASDASLPAKSDMTAVDDFLVSTYRRAWDGGLFA